MNNMKISIKDYQIIKKASLEFSPGLNVIVGPSNNGKSSILKAIKANVFTVPGSTPIRCGQPNYAVGIVYNGHTVILQKGLKESIYLVDGEKYTKYGTTTPEVVSKALNIRELLLNGNKEQLNFWDQMNYPFLLDKSPVELFRFIIDSGDDDQVTKALKDMVSDRQTISKSIDTLQGSISAVDDMIENYNKTLEKSQSIVSTCDKIIDLQPKISRLELLKSTSESLKSIKTQKESILNDLSKVNNQYEQLKDSFTKINNLSSRLDILSGYFIKLHITIGDLSDNAESLLKINKLASIKSIDASRLTDLKNIKSNINYILSKRKDIQEHSHKSYDINITKDVIKLDNLKQIKKDLIKFKDSKDAVDASNKKIEDSIKLYNSLKLLYDVCPLCGHKISLEGNIC